MSELRPLSPHGEGYCRACHFIIGLADDGRLEFHSRGRHGSAPTVICPGGKRKPPKITPYRSTKAMFKPEPDRTDCPLCGKNVARMFDGRLWGHPAEGYPATAGPHSYPHCPASYNPLSAAERLAARQRNES